MFNLIRTLVLSFVFLFSCVWQGQALAQKRGFENDRVASLISSYYAARGMSLPSIKHVLETFAHAKGKPAKITIVVLADGRLFLSRPNTSDWFEFVMNGRWGIVFRDLPRTPIAFEATLLNTEILTGDFDFVPTEHARVVPPVIVSPERFLDHLITWMFARGISPLDTDRRIAFYDLIARNHYLRVVGVDNIELVLFGLVELGFDINETDEYGDTMLFTAIEASDVDFVKALIQAGADVNATNDAAQLPEEFAAEIGNAQIINLINEAVAKENDIDDDDEKEEKADAMDVEEGTMLHFEDDEFLSTTGLARSNFRV